MIGRRQALYNEQERRDNAPAEETEQDSGQTEPQPIGRGVFGNIYDQFRGKVKEAVRFLMGRKEGIAKGALHHRDVGDIDLWYGDDKAGLKKIAEKHPEVIDDLQGIIDGMRVVSASDNRIILESDTHRAVVSKMLGNEKTDNWLLSAYEKKDASGGSSDIGPEPGEGKQNGTAPLQDNPSADKGNEKVPDGQKDSDNPDDVPPATPTTDGGGVPVGERGAANRDAADGGERMRNEKETDKEKATAGERGGAISGNPSSGSLQSESCGHLSHNALAPQVDEAKYNNILKRH